MKRTALLSVCLLLYAFVLVGPASASLTGGGPAAGDPVAVSETAETPEDTPVRINVLANDSDPDGDALSVVSARVDDVARREHATDRAAAAGIYEITSSWGANVGDINADGWPDLVVVRHNKVLSRVYLNDHGVFREVNAGMLGPYDRHDCPMADVNRDGRLDIYCTLGAQYGQTGKSNELWIQQADGTFLNKASQFGVSDAQGRGRYATFIDVNHDLYPDLYVTNDYPRQDAFLSPNRLFINQRGGSFRDASEYGLNKEVGGLCVEAADYNNDGWQDLLVCGNESLRLFRNNQGQSFTDVSAQMGLTEWASNAVLVDLNRDGKLDLAEVDLWSFQVRLQGSGVFQSPAARTTLVWGTDIEAADANADGTQDLYVVQGGKDVNNPDMLLLNGGSGTSFMRAPIPQDASGRGDAAVAFDFDRDGAKEFLVLNGHFRFNWDFTSKVPGPVQLIGYQATNGTVVNNGDGTVTYTPNRDFTGTDTFSYTVSDGRGGTATATDTVTVRGVNDPPIAVADYVNTRINTSVKINVVATDTDRDGNPLKATSIVSAPGHGRATVNTDGTVTYVPATGYSGNDSFVYRVADGQGGDSTASVIVRVLAAGGCTIMGADRTQIFYGRPGVDVICGAGGNDFVYSHGGNDVLKGDDANDVLLGGLGNDKYLGGPGTDICRDIGGTSSFSGCEKR